jgi:GNAT superfamily N-acetyltransferase
MTFREANAADIKHIQYIRHAVKENVLSDPLLVTDEDCNEYITVRGKGWVCELNDKMVGFAIADLKENSIWALFLLPEFENKGIGKKLQQIMLSWYFGQTTETVWLTTSPGTRAEGFYKKSGWREKGRKDNGEIRFEMTFEDWLQSSNRLNINT